MTISWPSNTTEIIDEIRGAIGREVEFITATLSGCSACSLDPITNTSTDSWCTVCSGEYWIPTYYSTLVSGHITWGPSDFINWYRGGQQVEGDCRIQIKFTSEHADLVKNALWVNVDGKKMEIKKSMLRGVQQINRILIDTKEVERDT